VDTRIRGGDAYHHSSIAEGAALPEYQDERSHLGALQGLFIRLPLPSGDRAQMAPLIQWMEQSPTGTSEMAVTVAPGQAVFRGQRPGAVPQIPEPFGIPAQVGIQRQPYLDPGAEARVPMLLPVPVRQSAQTDHGVSCRLAVSAQALRALLGQGTLGPLRITLDDQPQTLPG